MYRDILYIQTNKLNILDPVRLPKENSGMHTSSSNYTYQHDKAARTLLTGSQASSVWAPQLSFLGSRRKFASRISNSHGSNQTYL
jgi:hypothetical protein